LGLSAIGGAICPSEVSAAEKKNDNIACADVNRHKTANVNEKKEEKQQQQQNKRWGKAKQTILG
jgi:hypothetical protein